MTDRAALEALIAAARDTARDDFRQRVDTEMAGGALRQDEGDDE